MGLLERAPINSDLVKLLIPVAVCHGVTSLAIYPSLLLLSHSRTLSKSILTSIVLKSNVTMLDIVSTRMLGQFGFLAKWDPQDRGRWRHGVTKLKQGSKSPEVVIIDSSSEEEQDGDSFSEVDWSADESELKGEELMDQISQVESDQIFARCLEEEINGEFHDTEGEEEEHDIDPNIMSFTSHANELDQINCWEPVYLNGQHFPLQVSPMQNSNLRRNEKRFSGPEMEHEIVSIS
ncbi:uncharacterized protein LOC144549920 [Carex rostrata]